MSLFDSDYELDANARYIMDLDHKPRGYGKGVVDNDGNVIPAKEVKAYDKSQAEG